MSNSFKPKFQTITKVRGFFFEAETVRTEFPSEHPPASHQTNGVESRERLRPSRPVGPGLVSVRNNVFALPARKTG